MKSPHAHLSVQPLLAPAVLRERQARLMQRRAFVELKGQFQAAVAPLQGAHADWLRYQVRQAEEPFDLWLLRSAVFGALNDLGEAARSSRIRLRRELESAFPDSALPAGYSSVF